MVSGRAAAKGVAPLGGEGFVDPAADGGGLLILISPMAAVTVTFPTP